MPSPQKNEEKSAFVSRCMSSDESKKSFPDQDHRVAFCHSQWSKSKGQSKITVYVYKNPKTNELHYFDRRGAYERDGVNLVFIRRDTMGNEHILNKAAKLYADEKAGYPPNCNEGYVEKNGKCVPMNEAEWTEYKKNKKKKH